MDLRRCEVQLILQIRNSKTGRTKAIFAGCSAHSMVALDKLATASFGISLGIVAHMVGWPIVRGGSQQIIDCMGKNISDRWVEKLLPVEKSKP